MRSRDAPLRSESGAAAEEEAARGVREHFVADGRVAGSEGERGSVGDSGVIVSDGLDSCVFVAFQTGPQERPHRSAHGCRRGQR